MWFLLFLHINWTMLLSFVFILIILTKERKVRKQKKKHQFQTVVSLPNKLVILEVKLWNIETEPDFFLIIRVIMKDGKSTIWNIFNNKYYNYNFVPYFGLSPFTLSFSDFLDDGSKLSFPPCDDEFGDWDSSVIVSTTGGLWLWSFSRQWKKRNKWIK